MDDPELDPFSLSVDDSHLPESSLLTFQEILFQKGRDFFGREGMEVDPVLYGNKDSVKFGVRSHGFGVKKPNKINSYYNKTAKKLFSSF